MSINKEVNELIEDFSYFESWEDKYQYLIDLGRSVPKMDENLKIDQNKFCATRRSAGVPYLIQAVVTTEPLESDYKCLKMALKQLIILSRDERAEVRIHAYNILRVLYRDSTLGEIVSPFVTDGLKAAILGFKATTWSVSQAFIKLQ